MRRRTAVILGMVAIIINGFGIFVALAPGFVTLVPKATTEITCNACGTGDVQTALAQAASLGQAHVQSMIQSFSWVPVGAAVINAVIIVLLISRMRSNFSSSGRAEARRSTER